jgi:hypothetical protein
MLLRESCVGAARRTPRIQGGALKLVTKRAGKEVDYRSKTRR